MRSDPYVRQRQSTDFCTNPEEPNAVRLWQLGKCYKLIFWLVPVAFIVHVKGS
jgi:hypothetical protein